MLYNAILSVLQGLGEHDYASVATALIESVAKAMAKVNDLCKNERSWDSLNDEDLPTLRGLIVRLANLSDLYINLPPTQHRSAPALVKAVNGASGGNFIRDAGILHRTTMLVVSSLKIKESAESEGPVEDPKGSAAKYLSSRLYSGLTKMFKCKYPVR